jgi:lipopolysaccharide/colanic/teichoic acid biosynthesis glycosyltransferase
VRLTSHGPAIFTQRRVGRNGLSFTIYKVRTMCVDAEAQGPRWCTPGDTRVTAVGRVLRKLHLDELPQLWNVIRGDMSLVGPRPERPEFMPKLRALVPNYNARHAVLPGITGLAQVQLGADTDIGNVFRKLRYDLYYIDHAGPWLEAQILSCTALKMFGVSLRKLRNLMSLEIEPVPQTPLRRAA